MVLNYIIFKTVKTVKTFLNEITIYFVFLPRCPFRDYPPEYMFCLSKTYEPLPHTNIYLKIPHHPLQIKGLSGF